MNFADYLAVVFIIGMVATAIFLAALYALGALM